MKKKKREADLFKSYIMEALVILLEKKKFSEITIKEITRKAGVNRSTYYRNFHSKEEIITFFYTYILEKCISIQASTKIEEHLLNIFNQFLSYKKELICLHENKLSYLLLEALNHFFKEHKEPKNYINFENDFEVCYHAGGVFNTFLLWFDYKMKPEPIHLVKKSLAILPKNFEPFLYSL